MKIAVTADVHLVPGDALHPQRLAALRDVLEQLPALDIDRLVIAGDLFDKDLQGYGEFEALCGEFPEISIEIIPGNHDPSLAPDHLLADNVTVYAEPQLVEFDQRQVLFVPYALGTRMGEVIEIYELRPADLLEIRGPEKTFMIPYISAMIQSVSVEDNRIVLDAH